MTDNEKKKIQDDYKNYSVSQLLVEFCRLILLLIWTILRKSCLVLWRLLVFLAEVVADAWERLVEWWNDNDTQEKVRKIKAATIKGCKTFGRWCVIAAKATIKWLGIAAVASWHGIVTGTKATIDGIIHLKPTVIKIGHLIVEGTKATIAFFVRTGKGIKLFHLRRKRAYAQFRRNKGFKGLLLDSSNAVRDFIRVFMEEDQEEATPDAVTEDDIFEEEMNEDEEDGNKARRFGKKIFSTAKDIMDAD